MRLLIKLGGTLLDEASVRARLAGEIAAAAATHRTAVVHGGGKQMTRFLEERGVESRFVNGLRVSTPAVIDAVVKVFAGSVNTQLVGAFLAAGAKPVGLTGLDAALVECEPWDPELGAVGRPSRANAALLELLTDHGYLPVVACMGGGRDGQVFNVNADQMAVACAAAFRADRLLFLTDVDGVRGADGSVLARLSSAEAGELISSGVASGGMQAKLEAARKALREGAGEVRIAAGTLPGIVEKLLGGGVQGTVIVP